MGGMPVVVCVQSLYTVLGILWGNTTSIDLTWQMYIGSQGHLALAMHPIIVRHVIAAISVRSANANMIHRARQAFIQAHRREVRQFRDLIRLSESDTSRLDTPVICYDKKTNGCKGKQLGKVLTRIRLTSCESRARIGNDIDSP